MRRCRCRRDSDGMGCVMILVVIVLAMPIVGLYLTLVGKSDEDRVLGVILTFIGIVIWFAVAMQ